MTTVLTRGDTVREYLSGAASDGGIQTSPALSLGGRRSSTEVVSLGMVITNAIPNVTISHASGANPIGAGLLTAIDDNNLRWKPFGDADYGPPARFDGVDQDGVVEANGTPGRFLRVTATTPLNHVTSTVTLSYIENTLYGFPDVSIDEAAAGVNHYRASIVKNVGSTAISGYNKYLATLGTPATSSAGSLPASGEGTITTGTNFDSWPSSGWCQVRSSVGVLKEIVYYSSRTSTALTVPADGRSLLGTSATAGATNDVVYPVPGIAIGLDPAGVLTGSAPIQTVASPTAAPVGVTWVTGIDASGGLSVGTLQPNEQVGVWLWRQIPPGTAATPTMLNKVWDTFNAF